MAVPAVITVLAATSAAASAAVAGGTGPTAGPRVVATIPVGNGPTAVAVNPRTDAVYVVNTGSKSVSVINGRTNKIVRTIHISDGKALAPGWIALNPSSGDVYVSNDDPANVAARGTVTIISGRTAKVIATVPVGRNPDAAVISPRTGAVYVASQGAVGTVTVISGRSSKAIATISMGGYLGQLAVSPQTGEVYAPSTENGTVAIISGQSNKVTATLLVDKRESNPTNDLEPYEVAVSSVTGEVYIVSVGYHTGNTETVLNGRTHKVIATIGNMGTGAGAIVISPRTGAVYIETDVSGTMLVLNGQTNKVTQFIQLGSGFDASTAVINPRTGNVYAPGNLDQGTSRPVAGLAVVSGQTGKVIATLRLRGSSPGPVGVNSVTGDVYAASWNFIGADDVPAAVSVVAG